MKPKVRNILIAVAVSLAVGYVAGSAIWLGTRSTQERCGAVEIDILDEDVRQYVTRNELIQLLQSGNVYPVGKTLTIVSARQIEKTIESHPMVRDAEVYVSSHGDVKIELHQRRPLLRIVSGTDCYFVDSDHEQMPIRETVKDPLLTAEGRISVRMATHELAEMAEWIAENEYWNTRIRAIHVRNPKMIELIQYNTQTRILLGGMDDYRGKMNKLEKLYRGGFYELEQPPYRELDLRFDGQVVGRK